MRNHNSVEAAITWVDAATHPLNGEDVPLCIARGRVLTEPIRAAGPIPASDQPKTAGAQVFGPQQFQLCWVIEACITHGETSLRLSPRGHFVGPTLVARSGRRNTKVRLTHRRRELDSNCWFRDAILTPPA